MADAHDGGWPHAGVVRGRGLPGRRHRRPLRRQRCTSDRLSEARLRRHTGQPTESTTVAAHCLIAALASHRPVVRRRAVSRRTELARRWTAPTPPTGPRLGVSCPIGTANRPTLRSRSYAPDVRSVCAVRSRVGRAAGCARGSRRPLVVGRAAQRGLGGQRLRPPRSLLARRIVACSQTHGHSRRGGAGVVTPAPRVLSLVCVLGDDDAEGGSAGGQCRR
jgi:hypothetical protein